MPEVSGDRQTAVWVIIAVVIAAGVAAMLLTVVPRLRRLASARVRPHLVQIWADLKTIATEPRKIFYVLAGSVLSQLVIVLALGASLHAVDEHVSLATLFVVNMAAGLIGAAIPVPGGAGVVEGRPDCRADQRGRAAGARPSPRYSSSGCSPPTCRRSGDG